MGIGSILPLNLKGGGLSETSQDTLSQIKNNFINLIMTRPGERFGNPEFGCDIHELVFNFNGESLQNEIEDVVEEAVRRWMPYISLEEVVVERTSEDVDRNRYRIYMKYRLSEQPTLTDEVLIEL